MSDTRTRLSTDQKIFALTLLARGDTLSQIVGAIYERFQLEITESAISQLGKKNQTVIAEMRKTLEEAEVADAEAILKKSRRMISAKLNKADRDGQELEELDRRYREGEIKFEEYKRRKAGLMRVTLNELNAITKSMHNQTIKHAAPALPAGSSGTSQPTLPAGPPQTPAQLEALMKSIQSGDTVELQRIIFTPGQPA